MSTRRRIARRRDGSTVRMPAARNRTVVAMVGCSLVLAVASCAQDPASSTRESPATSTQSPTTTGTSAPRSETPSAELSDELERVAAEVDLADGYASLAACPVPDSASLLDSSFGDSFPGEVVLTGHASIDDTAGVLAPPGDLPVSLGCFLEDRSGDNSVGLVVGPAPADFVDYVEAFNNPEGESTTEIELDRTGEHVGGTFFQVSVADPDHDLFVREIAWLDEHLLISFYVEGPGGRHVDLDTVQERIDITGIIDDALGDRQPENEPGPRPDSPTTASTNIFVRAVEGVLDAHNPGGPFNRCVAERIVHDASRHDGANGADVVDVLAQMGAVDVAGDAPWTSSDIEVAEAAGAIALYPLSTWLLGATDWCDADFGPYVSHDQGEVRQRGDSIVFDRFADDCDDADWTACDALSMFSEGAFREFGRTCGGRVSPSGSDARCEFRVADT